MLFVTIIFYCYLLSSFCFSFGILWGSGSSWVPLLLLLRLCFFQSVALGVTDLEDQPWSWCALSPSCLTCTMKAGGGAWLTSGQGTTVITSGFEQDTEAGLSFGATCWTLLPTKCLHQNVVCGQEISDYGYGDAYGPWPIFRACLWTPGGSYVSHLLVLSCFDPC